MNATKNKLNSIVSEAYRNQRWPLEVNQCLHWADVARIDILVTFLPDLERKLQEDGKMEAAQQVAAFRVGLNTPLNN